LAGTAFEAEARSMADKFLDNRGLEPPNPMIRTLEALDEMAPGEVLTIHNDRVPVYLLPQLADAGAEYEVLEQDDGSAQVRITKGA
jgi:TusA-related sulfurtransferase